MQRSGQARLAAGSVTVGPASDDTPRDEQVRAAEVIGVLCLATDLGMGFPFEHGLQSTLIAMRLTERLGVTVDPATASLTYSACLLSHSGCTTDAHVTPGSKRDLLPLARRSGPQLSQRSNYGDSLTAHLHPVMYYAGRGVLLV